MIVLDDAMEPVAVLLLMMLLAAVMALIVSNAQ